MPLLGFGPGLMPRVPSPPPAAAAWVEMGTEEAGLTPPAGRDLRVAPLVEEGKIVAEGAPVARLRDAPGICLVAPIPGRVARISLRPGRRLS